MEGKHISFDGQKLHGAPCNPPLLAGDSRESAQRVTLLVNVWINHLPLSASRYKSPLGVNQHREMMDTTEGEQLTEGKGQVESPVGRLELGKEARAGWEEWVSMRFNEPSGARYRVEFVLPMGQLHWLRLQSGGVSSAHLIFSTTEARPTGSTGPSLLGTRRRHRDRHRDRPGGRHASWDVDREGDRHGRGRSAAVHGSYAHHARPHDGRPHGTRSRGCGRRRDACNLSLALGRGRHDHDGHHKLRGPSEVDTERGPTQKALAGQCVLMLRAAAAVARCGRSQRR